MPISAAMLPEFDHEMANTRKTLERVPEAKFDWKPHAKSMAMGRLAQHLAMLPQWGQMTIAQDSLDLAPGGVPVPLVNGVKNLKILYGVKRNPVDTLSCADTYLNANQMAPVDWNNVCTVKVTVSFGTKELTTYGP